MMNVVDFFTIIFVKTDLMAQTNDEFQQTEGNRDALSILL